MLTERLSLALVLTFRCVCVSTSQSKHTLTHTQSHIHTLFRLNSSISQCPYSSPCFVPALSFPRVVLLSTPRTSSPPPFSVISFHCTSLSQSASFVSFPTLPDNRRFVTLMPYIEAFDRLHRSRSHYQSCRSTLVII